MLSGGQVWAAITATSNKCKADGSAGSTSIACTMPGLREGKLMLTRAIAALLLACLLFVPVGASGATITVAESGEDGWSESTDEQVVIATARFGVFYLGNYTVDSTTHDLDGGWIFRSTGVPQGSTITACTVTLQIDTDDVQVGTPEGTWYGYAVDSPTDFNAADAHRISDHHTRTTASVGGNIAGSTTTLVSSSLTTICQEIVNRAGYTGDIGLTWRNTGTGADKYWPWLDYGDTPASAAVLTITWSGGASAPRTLMLLGVGQ